jgi:hypothetical protein
MRTRHAMTPNAAREYNPKLATKTIDPTTPVVLEMWRDGAPAEVIAAKVGKTVRAVQLVASYHKVRRPDWYLSAVRGKVSALQFEVTA